MRPGPLGLLIVSGSTSTALPKPMMLRNSFIASAARNLIRANEGREAIGRVGIGATLLHPGLRYSATIYSALGGLPIDKASRARRLPAHAAAIPYSQNSYSTWFAMDRRSG